MGPESVRVRGFEKWAGGCSIGAAAVHGGVVQEHLKEWWGYGLFFIIASAAQLAWGLAILLHAINARDFGPNWERARRALLWAGIVGNALMISLYTVTRTTGIPFFGPGAGEVEEVAPIDIVAKSLEAAVIVFAFVLLRLPAPAAPNARPEAMV